MTKIEPADLESFEVDLEKEIKEFSPEKLEKRRALQKAGKISEGDEKEILTIIVNALYQGTQSLLPFYLRVFITKKLLRKIALFIYRRVVEKVIDLL